MDIVFLKTAFLFLFLFVLGAFILNTKYSSDFIESLSIGCLLIGFTFFMTFIFTYF